ncbi:MAG: SPOR domain-containing protein [Candidatus Latescibacteria bacterium]|nr:SPOR domain-containing protein [Candidatus Latescibacterota bacterium]MBT4137221.1 SPOR domain-containing protein [Candidatus Latescibacterota bacterium]
MRQSQYINYFILLFGAVIFGCGSTQSGLELPTSGPSTIREEFDPYTLNDDDFLLQPTSRARTQITSNPTTPIITAQPAPTSLSKQTSGYRVQIAAVLDRSRAEALQKSIQRQLQALTYVYYDEDTHLYKIQAGNHSTPAESEKLRDQIRAQGYPEAYVVRTQIEMTTTVQPQIKKPVKTRGFRLQIFSASTRQAAEDARNRAKQQLSRDDIFIDFEPPYFKVRIGNFKTRKDAEKLRDTAKKQGYETPFVVETQIQTSPQ